MICRLIHSADGTPWIFVDTNGNEIEIEEEIQTFENTVKTRKESFDCKKKICSLSFHFIPLIVEFFFHKYENVSIVLLCSSIVVAQILIYFSSFFY